MNSKAPAFLGSSPGRWAKIGSLFCFAITCGLLIGSLVEVQRAGSAASPTIPPDANPV
ncbi:MAG: hypothetical protein ACM3L9_03205 [Deltaproteobacteria bacterium]